VQASDYDRFDGTGSAPGACAEYGAEAA